MTYRNLREIITPTGKTPLHRQAFREATRMMAILVISWISDSPESRHGSSWRWMGHAGPFSLQIRRMPEDPATK